MPFTTYAQGLKQAQDLAQRAILIESSLSTLPPTASPLPTLLRAFPLYISSAESYSHLLDSSLVPTLADRVTLQKKWRLVLERAEKVKKKVEQLGGAVGRAEIREEEEEAAVARRGGRLNGLVLQSWDEIEDGGRSAVGNSRGPNDAEFIGERRWRDTSQPSLGELNARWDQINDESWDVDEQQRPGEPAADMDSNRTSKAKTKAEVRVQRPRWLARQGPGADCSISAAMTVCFEHNRLYGTTLGKEALYPHSINGRPRKSDNGKHIVRLLINGLWRGVYIDSLLPFSPTSSRPLHITSFSINVSSTFNSPLSLDPPQQSSSSPNSSPAWLPLATKAYFKALGGYDIPGSDPSPDVYAFTGWIPERLSLRHGFQREKEWERLKDGWNRGKVMVTLGTGQAVSAVDCRPSGASGLDSGSAGVGTSRVMGEGKGITSNVNQVLKMAAHERTVMQVPLIPLHAYAVLDVREEGGQRFLEIYDPGRSKIPSDGISISIQNLNLNNHHANDGVATFIMSWDDVCNKFDTVNLNWNPDLLPTTATRHWSWPKPSPASETSAFGTSPRYRLKIKSTPGSEVWVLLSQHMVNRDRRLDDVALRIVQVFGPGNHPMAFQIAPPSLGAPYTNALHTLVRRELRNAECVFDVMPVRDGGDFQTGFTLSAFASSGAEMTLERIRTSLPFIHTIPSALTKRNSGGNPGFPTHHLNPQYKLSIGRPSINAQETEQSLMNGTGVGQATVRISLRGSPEVPWNVRVMYGRGELLTDFGEEDVVCSSGSYSYGMAFAEEVNIQPGDYTIIVSCFEPGQVGPYTLSVESTAPLSVSEIPSEGAGLFSRVITGTWDQHTAGGRPSTSMYHMNPKLELILPKPATIFARLSLPIPSSSIPLNISIFKRDTGGALGELVSTSGPYIDRTTGVVTPRTRLDAGVYVVVPSTYESGFVAHWGVSLWSSTAMELERV